MYDLFKEDLTGKSYQYIGNWILSCRNLLYQQNYSSYQEFVSIAAKISDEWEQHYKSNPSVYEDKAGKCSETFQRALYYTIFLEKDSCGIDFVEGRFTLPLTEESKLSDLHADRAFITSARSAIREAFESDYHSLVRELNGEFYKEDLRKRIKERFNEETWLVYATQENKPIAATSLPKFVATCSVEDCKIDCHHSCVKKWSYNDLLGECGISKSSYHDYMGFKHSEKAFDKKMFVNIAFLLGLSYPLAEKLLNLNGYTFEGSNRTFDKLCAKGFKLGFGRVLTNALIDKRNIELGGDEIPNLMLNNKEMRISNLLAP